jgi:hypothetical protein
MSCSCRKEAADTKVDNLRAHGTRECDPGVSVSVTPVDTEMK